MELILIAGMPASGKSSFAAWAGERLGIPVFSKDEFKEDLFDTVGFRSYGEKRLLDAAATRVMLRCAGAVLGRGGPVILDNNFEATAVPVLETLAGRYGCRTLTVLFTGEAEAIFTRYLERERDPRRHPGHVARRRYPGPAGGEEPETMTAQGFQEKFLARGVAGFSLGETLKVDATDLDRVSYPEILAWIRSRLGEE